MNWTRQPPFPARIVPGFSAFASSNNLASQGTGVPLVYNGSPGFVYGPHGSAWDFSGQYIDLGALPVLSACTLICTCRVNQADTFPLSSRSSSGTQGVEFCTGIGGVAGTFTARFGSSSANISGVGIAGLNDGKYHTLVVTWTSGTGPQFYVDGRFVEALTSLSGTITSSQNLRIASRAATLLTGQVALGALLPIDIGRASALALSFNVWQSFEPLAKTPLIAAQAITSYEGYVLETLQKLSDTGRGLAGTVGYDLETLQKLQDQGYGFTQVNATGFASETLKALTDSARGLTGVVGFDLETLKLLQDSGTGTVQTSAATGYGAETLKALTDTGTGRTGAVGYDSETLKRLTESGTGITGVMGISAETLQPLQDIGFAESGAEPVPQGRVFGAPAWYGYEGFDGTKRPWWYKDLKDKAKELERQRQIRIDLGILPKDEDKEIKSLIKATETFVEKIPTPKNADQMIAKAEALANKLELLVDSLQEEDDEQTIMEMSQFFFHHNEVRV